ncbi:unnamed protein product [Camellia sinensis]
MRHFLVKNSVLSTKTGRNEMLINHSHNITTNLNELRLYHMPVFLDPFGIHFVSIRLFLLLNRRQDPPRRPPRTHHFLIPHRKQVPLLNSQFYIHIRNLLHRMHQICMKSHNPQIGQTLTLIATSSDQNQVQISDLEY